ncbi:MAG TPA: hypothetical protein VFL57_10710, partial [Bryobacteraceae bacterium]|nr:hypothetical protein [Bryobacteraceae bacterium]
MARIIIEREPDTHMGGHEEPRSGQTEYRRLEPDPVHERNLRLFSVSALYLVAGIVVAAFILSTLHDKLFQLRVDTAATAVPLEEVVSQESGTVADVHVQPRTAVKAGQPLLRLRNDSASREVQLARQHLELMRIAVASAQAKRTRAEREARLYQHISRSQLQSAEARIAALSAERDVAQADFDRSGKLHDEGLISRQQFESERASLARRDGQLREAVAAEQIAKISARGSGSGTFFSGNFLVGDLQDTVAEAAAARERVTMAEAALESAIAREQQRLYLAPCDGTVLKVVKGPGAPVGRGETILTLRRARGAPHVDAWISGKHAAHLARGSRGTGYIPAHGKHYAVEIASIEYAPASQLLDAAVRDSVLAGSDAMYPLVRVKLSLVDVKSSDDEVLEPGLPVRLRLAKHNRLPNWAAFWKVPKANAAAPRTSSSRAAPRLWPSSSVPFSRDGMPPEVQNGFDGVRRRVLEAAAKALRTQAMPVPKLQSAGIADKNSPILLQTRRAFEDADRAVLLALAYALTGEREYNDHARTILRAWADV